MTNSGIFIVTLKNTNPLPININNTGEDRFAKVNYKNIKIGFAKRFIDQNNNYNGTFGEENVVFTPILIAEQYVKLKNAVVKELTDFRISNPNRGKTEWFVGIDKDQLTKIIFDTAKAMDIKFDVFASKKA
jgi:hypothetical protein